MVIGLDGRAFYGSPAGTGRYVTALCQVLDRSFPNARFIIYANRDIPLPVKNSRWCQRCDHPTLAMPVPPTIWPPALWYFFRAGLLARQDKVDLFWGCANFLPLGLPKPIPAVLTLYDFVFRLFPRTLNFRHRLIYRLFFRQSLRRADRIVTISRGTADRLHQFHGYRADEVVRPASQALFQPVTPKRADQVRAGYRLDFPYFLAVSTLEPRKNLDVLIDALCQFTAKSPFQHMGLVLVGQQGWRHRKLLRKIQDAKAKGLRIVQTGYVSDNDLTALYHAAVAVVMPSLYEGFGLPVYEALRCGAPVISSDVPEMREAGGAHAIYVSPTIEGIQSGLAEAVLRSGTRPRITVPEQECWTWDDEGGKLAALLTSLVDDEILGDGPVLVQETHEN